MKIKKHNGIYYEKIVEWRKKEDVNAGDFWCYIGLIFTGILIHSLITKEEFGFIISLVGFLLCWGFSHLSEWERKVKFEKIGRSSQ